MIIRTELFQDACKKILEAVDSNVATIVSETLELEAHGDMLHLNVTNREYYVRVSLALTEQVNFRAVVSANLFLNLIAKITTKDLELTTTDTMLLIKGNGEYKIPLIYDGEKLVELPLIKIGEVTNEFTISNDILQSILKYNTKELQKSGLKQPVQKMFYIDEHGAITFTSGACVNSFTLEKPIKFLLNEKIVKLFKLFKSDNVEFKMGFDSISGGLTQTKVQFKNNEVELTTIIQTSSDLVNGVPVTAIRRMAEEAHNYRITVDKQALLSAIERLSLFAKKDVATLYSCLVFNPQNVTIYDSKKENYETIGYISGSIDGTYECGVNTNDLKLTLSLCEDTHVTFNFGNHRSMVIDRPQVKNILPECILK